MYFLLRSPLAKLELCECEVCQAPDPILHSRPLPPVSIFIIFALLETKQRSHPVSAAIKMWIPASTFAKPASYQMGTRDSPGVKLTSHLNLLLKLRMYGAIPTLPHTSSWCV